MKKFIVLLFLMFISTVYSQTLPSGYIGRVLNNTPGQWQKYTFTFTAATTGSNYFMLAFRQDPAYWRVDNVKVTAPGNNTNLLVNGDMSTGGTLTKQVGGQTQYINAPTAWGVAYQNNTYPAAAGTWTGGLWYDGAVGSFDAIYQAIRVTAGVTYTISFDVNGDNTSDGNSVQLGVYAGSCSDVSLAPSECGLPSSSGFTPLAKPSETYTTGCGNNCPVNPDAGGGNTWPGSDGITNTQLAQKNSAKTRVANIQLGNYIYLEEKIGSSGSNVTIEQSGSYNKIAGLGGTSNSIIDGDNNIINIKQGSVIGKNLIEFTITGDSNNLTIWQARNLNTGLGQSGDSGGHYTGVNITGNTNTLSIKQNNDGGSNSGQFSYIDVLGNNNQGVLKQIGNNEKIFFGVLSGNNNVFDVTQQNTGNHYFFITLNGNGHNVTANQKDSGSHNATINLTNSGGASTVTLTQQGNTAQSINITQQCATLAGCSVSVTQGQ